MRRLFIALLSPLLLANTDPSTIPPAIKAMLDAAIASGNDAEIATVVKYARIADPKSGDAAQALAAAWAGDRVREKNVVIEQASFLDLWTGRIELGGTIATGNADSFGATGVIDATREGLKWRQKFLVQADYAEALGVPTRRHALAQWQPNYKIDDHRYVAGTALFESDPFLGYHERYSAAVGAGYGAVRNATMTLNLELGPAFRQTRFTDGRKQSSLASRGSVDFDWKMTPGVNLSQDAAIYLERYNSTISSTTAVTARVLGPLAASLSYNVQYESDPPVGRVSTDTIGRASLVYTF
jgi:putative salt-induced outer membrane protein